MEGKIIDTVGVDRQPESTATLLLGRRALELLLGAIRRSTTAIGASSSTEDGSALGEVERLIRKALAKMDGLEGRVTPEDRSTEVS